MMSAGKGAKARAYQQRTPELAAAYHGRREHSIKRVAQRYGLEMSLAEYEALCNQMPNAKAEERYLARRVPHPKEKGEIRYYAVFWRKASRWLLAVYSFRSFQIVTFMPPEFLPSDLPSSVEVNETLARGASLIRLREELDRGEVPISIDGEIVWEVIGMQAPESVSEARVYLKLLSTQIITIHTQLATRDKKATLSPEEYKDWTRRAKWALAWRTTQAAALKSYIAMMEMRSSRMAGTGCTEALLAEMLMQLERMRSNGRATCNEDDWRVLDGVRQHLRDLGWRAEDMTVRVKEGAK